MQLNPESTISHAPRRVMLVMVWSEPAHHVGIGRFTRKAGWMVGAAGPGQHEMVVNTPLNGIISQLYPTAPELISAVQNAHVPIVELSDKVPEMVVPRVIPDYYAVGTSAADHFIQKGYKHLVYVGLHKDAHMQNSAHNGFMNRAEQTGCSVTFLYTDDIPGRKIGDSHVYLWDNDATVYRQWFGSRIAELPKPLGIFSSQSMYSLDVTEGCLAAGMLIPEEVALLVYADYDRECELTPVPISNIALDFELQAFRAAEVLEHMMNGEDIPPETIYVPPKPIVTRSSSNINAFEHRETAIIIGYIMRNLHRNSLSVTDIIRETGISQGKLYYCFDKHVGQPVASYISSKRIEKAAALLKAHPMNSAEITELCGFTDLKHFLRTLKRLTGLKFSEFRDQCHTKPLP